MKMIERIQDKKRQKSLRTKRKKSIEQTGATTWNEQQQRKENTKGFFTSSFMMWMKKDGWALCGIFIIVFGFFGNALFFSEKRTLTAITISDTSFIEKSKIEKEIENYLNEKSFFFLPKKSYFLASTENIQQHIQNAFLDQYALESVSVEKIYPNILTVNIQERIPSVTWITGDEKNQKIYTVDQNGVVTQELQTITEANAGYPIVRDKNRTSLGIGWYVISPEYMQFTTELHSTLYDTTNLSVKEFVLPKIECFQKEYVAEEVFKKAQNKEDSDEIKERKRAIQERFQRGEITIDESITLLEQINAENKENEPEEPDTEKEVERIEWEMVNAPIECDIVEVGQDIYAKVENENKKEFMIYFDTTQDMNIQLEHVVSIIETQVKDITQLEYIDVRILDRVYYQ